METGSQHQHDSEAHTWIGVHHTRDRQADQFRAAQSLRRGVATRGRRIHGARTAGRLNTHPTAACPRRGEDPALAVTLSLVFPQALPAEEPALGGVFESCAVVGSSGHMLKFQNGREIDAHEMVFRFNSAPTLGFEKHVGMKTTHRLTNTRNFGFRESDAENVYIHIRNAGARPVSSTGGGGRGGDGVGRWLVQDGKQC